MRAARRRNAVRALFLSGRAARPERARRGRTGGAVYYDADFYARPAWNAAGTGTAIKNGAALTWVGLDNEVLRTAAFGDPAAGPGLSPEDITLTIGEGWVLRTVPGTRAALREGKWTLLNAALYDLDGTLLHAFPDASPEEVEAATGDYEKQSAYVNAYPLGSGHIALETGAMLLLYDIAADALSLVDDYRDVRWQGFTVYDAGAYGIYQCWPFGESLYYMASIDPAARRAPPGALPPRHGGGAGAFLRRHGLFPLQAGGGGPLRLSGVEQRDLYRRGLRVGDRGVVPPRRGRMAARREGQHRLRGRASPRRVPLRLHLDG